MQLLPPNPNVNPGDFTHAIITLAVVIGICVLVGIGKLDATSATPLLGAALGVSALAPSQRRPPPPGG